MRPDTLQNGLDYMNDLVSGRIEHPPAAKLLGFRWVEVEYGKAVVKMQACEDHENLMGSMHGGIICSLSDAAMGGAFGSTLKKGQSHTTLELKTNFLKPVWDSKLVAKGKVVKRGRTIGLAECEIYDEKKVMVAKTTGTFMVLEGQMAQDRGLKQR